MTVVAVLAHPDDELMCAGTLARLTRTDEVILATAFVDPDRAFALTQSCKALGITSYPLDQKAGISESTFGWDQNTVRRIEGTLPYSPRLFIGHRINDDNTSHGPLARIVRTLARKNNSDVWECDSALPGGIVPEAPGPNFFVNTTPFQAQKSEAVAAYPMVEVTNPGWSAAITARDQFNGWQLTREWGDSAEAFRVVKQTWA